MKKRQLERHLTGHGCRLAREAAEHELWENPAAGQQTTVPRHREIKMPTARGICRQLGVPPTGRLTPWTPARHVSRNMSRTQQF